MCELQSKLCHAADYTEQEVEEAAVNDAPKGTGDASSTTSASVDRGDGARSLDGATVHDADGRESPQHQEWVNPCELNFTCL